MTSQELIDPQTLYLIQAAVIGATALAFTAKQRITIRRERDGDQCQFPPHLNGHGHECGGRLEVHHIKPQRYMKALGIDEKYVDVPENALTVCSNAHQLIHPDIRLARQKYGMDRESYHKCFEAREETLKDHKPYWETEWDRVMEVRALQLTQRLDKKKPEWREIFKGNYPLTTGS